MGHIGGNTFRFLRRQQTWRGNGPREIEPQPEQPARNSADEAFLRANFKAPTRPPDRVEHCVKATQSRKP
jgi:hypothetical protein